MPIVASPPKKGAPKPAPGTAKLVAQYNTSQATQQRKLAAERKVAAAFLEAASKRTQARIEKAAIGSLDLKEARAALEKLGTYDPVEHRSALTKLGQELAPGIAATRKALGLEGDGAAVFAGPVRPLGGTVQRDLAAATLPLVDILRLLEAEGCVDQTFTSPFPLHDASPGNSVRNGRELETATMWQFLGWPHDWAKLGTSFRVRATDRHVTVSATPQVVVCQAAVVGIVGFAHAWARLRLSVSDGARELASMVAEPVNLATFLGETDHSIGERGEFVTQSLTCSFTRRPTDTTSYLALLEATTDATVAGFGGAFAWLVADLDAINVHACGT